MLFDDGYVEYDDWFFDLTIEQKRAAYFAWIKDGAKSIHADGTLGMDHYTLSDDMVECPICKRILNETPDHR